MAPRENPGGQRSDPTQAVPTSHDSPFRDKWHGFSAYSFCKLMLLIISLDAEATIWILASSSAFNVLHMLFNLESIISLLLH